jgi:hypothetical protein
MRGTLVCAVTDGEESADALVLGAELSARLGLRLVLAHAVAGIDGSRENSESTTMKANRQRAERRLAQAAQERPRRRARNRDTGARADCAAAIPTGVATARP